MLLYKVENQITENRRMNNNKGYWRASARLFCISAYEPSSPSVCRPWLHLCRSQVWPWRGTWLAGTAIAEQVHHAPGDTHTKPTKTQQQQQQWEGLKTLICQSKGTICREQDDRKALLMNVFLTVSRFLLCARENSESSEMSEGELHRAATSAVLSECGLSGWISSLGFLLKFPFHCVRHISTMRQETSTRGGVNQSFGDS